jgi:hypothetical protein
MVRANTNSMSIDELHLKLKSPISEDAVYSPGESIEITSDFQRGDDETGVWTRDSKHRYIMSLMAGYPTGIITLVKDHETATSYQNPWKVLDGGNRLRTIRDFKTDKLVVKSDSGTTYQFSKLTPQKKADFNTIMIPCQFLNIERSDPDDTIAEMFCCLNTSATKLSHGELFKAHGWKNNNCEIEMAKKLVGGDTWGCEEEGNEAEDGKEAEEAEEDNIAILRKSWCENVGELRETKRCDSLAMMIGYIMSAKTGNFKRFNPKYDDNKALLSPASQNLTEDDMNTIVGKLTKFVEIMGDVEYSKEIFGRPTGGILSKSKIAPIWKPICEGELTPELREKLVNFYNVYVKDDDVRAEYMRRLTKNGDNHTNASKIEAVHEYINEICQERAAASE